MYVIFKKPIIIVGSHYMVTSKFLEKNYNEDFEVLKILKFENLYKPYNSSISKYLTKLDTEVCLDSISVKSLQLEDNNLIIKNYKTGKELAYSHYLSPAILKYLNILIDNEIVELKEELTIDDYNNHLKTCSVRNLNLKEVYSKFINNFSTKCIISNKVKECKGIKTNLETQKDEMFTLKNVLLQSASSSFRYSNMPVLSSTSIEDSGYYYFYKDTDDYFIYNDSLLCLSNSKISCGVTQLYNIDNFASFCDVITDVLGIEEMQSFVKNIQNVLVNTSKGTTLIYSTTKRSIKDSKKVFQQLVEGKISTTRYTRNLNSGNKIGTTILILN